jgi:hypothetical protein
MQHPREQVLEQAQFSSAKQIPYPRRKLGGGTLALLVGLRIYVILAVPIVTYAFVHAMGK